MATSRSTAPILLEPSSRAVIKFNLLVNDASPENLEKQSKGTLQPDYLRGTDLQLRDA